MTVSRHEIKLLDGKILTWVSLTSLKIFPTFHSATSIPSNIPFHHGPVF